VPLPPFEDVVVRHGPAVLRVCRALVGRARAEDVWSETFVAALRAYPELPPGSNLQAWLVTIAQRKAVDQHRSSGRSAEPRADLPEQPVTDSYSSDGDDRLWAALASLPTTQRRAVAYHYLGGMAYRDVAELLGNSTDAARRAAADGIRTLRRTYLEELP
jgi:RNA polymerase sigma factor (sigma-70 family)